jgi:hypothetical protein
MAAGAIIRAEARTAVKTFMDFSFFSGGFHHRYRSLE